MAPLQVPAVHGRRDAPLLVEAAAHRRARHGAPTACLSPPQTVRQHSATGRPGARLSSSLSSWTGRPAGRRTARRRLAPERPREAETCARGLRSRFTEGAQDLRAHLPRRERGRRAHRHHVRERRRHPVPGSPRRPTSVSRLSPKIFSSTPAMITHRPVAAAWRSEPPPQVLQSPSANSTLEKAVLAARATGVLPAVQPGSGAGGAMVPVAALSYARSVFSHNGPRKMVCIKPSPSYLPAARWFGREVGAADSREKTELLIIGSDPSPDPPPPPRFINHTRRRSRSTTRCSRRSRPLPRARTAIRTTKSSRCPWDTAPVALDRRAAGRRRPPRPRRRPRQRSRRRPRRPRRPFRWRRSRRSPSCRQSRRWACSSRCLRPPIPRPPPRAPSAPLPPPARAPRSGTGRDRRRHPLLPETGAQAWRRRRRRRLCCSSSLTSGPSCR